MVLVSVSLAAGGTAHAAGPIGQNGDAITTSDYPIDMFQGPVFAGSRVTGLAGAYVAVAEDVVSLGGWYPRHSGTVESTQ